MKTSTPAQWIFRTLASTLTQCTQRAYRAYHTFLTYFAYCACCVISASLTLIPTNAFARSGGMDGGGGNVSPQKPVTAELIESVVSGSRADLKDFFQGLKARYLFLTLSNEQYPGSLDAAQLGLLKSLERYFALPEDQTATEALQKITWKLEADGACLDSEGTEQDASADASTKTICLSIPRLKTKLSERALARQILGLLAREVSELFGADKAEAEALQNQVEQAYIIEKSTRHSAQYRLMSDYLVAWLYKTEDRLKARASFADPDSFEKVCEDLRDPRQPFAIAAQGTQDLADNIQFLPTHAESMIARNTVGITGSLILASISCDPGGSKITRPIFKGRKEMKLTEFLHEFFKGSTPTVRPVVARDAVIRNVEYGDTRALLAQIILMRNQL